MKSALRRHCPTLVPVHTVQAPPACNRALPWLHTHIRHRIHFTYIVIGYAGASGGHTQCENTQLFAAQRRTGMAQDRKPTLIAHLSTQHSYAYSAQRHTQALPSLPRGTRSLHKVHSCPPSGTRARAHRPTRVPRARTEHYAPCSTGVTSGDTTVCTLCTKHARTLRVSAQPCSHAQGCSQ